MVSLLIFLLAAAALPAQTLRIAVTAFDEKTGDAITGLGPENFQVTDGDATLRVESVRPQDGPLDVLFIFDASLTGRAVRPYVPALIDALGEGEQMGLIAYEQSATLLQDFTSSRDLLRRAAAGARYGGNPRVLDALFAALDGGFETATPRRAIVVLTAGVEGRSRTGVSDVVRLARNRRATIHFVFEEGVDKSLFEKVALSAAGSWFHAKKLDLKPAEIGENVLQAVRSTYELEVSGVFTLSDALEVEITGAPAERYKKPVASVLSLE